MLPLGLFFKSSPLNASSILTREPFSKWKLHLLEQEKATVVRYLATIEEWLNNVDCSHDNPTATAQSTSISLGACSQAQVDRSTAPSMVPLLPDIAYSPRYGTTVRTQWKQLVKQGDKRGNHGHKSHFVFVSSVTFVFTRMLARRR